MLSTEKLPVPLTTLIDHKLVKELGLKDQKGHLKTLCDPSTYPNTPYRLPKPGDAILYA